MYTYTKFHYFRTKPEGNGEKTLANYWNFATTNFSFQNENIFLTYFQFVSLSLSLSFSLSFSLSLSRTRTHTDTHTHTLTSTEAHTHLFYFKRNTNWQYLNFSYFHKMCNPQFPSKMTKEEPMSNVIGSLRRQDIRWGVE